MRSIQRLAVLFLMSLLVSGLAAQVDLKQEAVVYFGSGANTSAPATIDEDRVRDATSEWQTIQSEGVRRGSARYNLLVAEMEKRIRTAVRAAVSEKGNDLVVRSGDIQDAKGKTVADITNDVIGKLNMTPLTLAKAAE